MQSAAPLMKMHGQSLVIITEIITDIILLTAYSALKLKHMKKAENIPLIFPAGITNLSAINAQDIVIILTEEAMKD